MRLKGLSRRRGTGNCLAWALFMWLSRGGYIVMRWSHWRLLKVIRFPHFMWCQTFGRVYGFAPLHPKNKTIPHLWFRGQVIRER